VSLFGQSDFGGGIFRSPRAPAGSVYDCVNGLVDDDRALFRRGGVAYLSNVLAAAELHFLLDGNFPAGARTLACRHATANAHRLLDDGSWQALTLAGIPRPYSRVAGYRGIVAIPTSVFGQVIFWGGAGLADYGTGTIAYTSGSTTVVGTGTAFVANVEPGMLLTVPITGGDRVYGVVRAVTDNTHIELLDPMWATATGITAAWKSSTLSPVGRPELGGAQMYVTSAGNRLIFAAGSRAYHYAQTQGLEINAPTDYHELPPPARILGADAIGDVAVLFATSGVWAIRNLFLDLTDATGELQQPQELLWKDLILWGDPGIVGLSRYAGVLGWSGQLIAPCMDDVFMLGVESAPIPLSRSIRTLYRAYVQAGYQPGGASVYRGHYVLPILDRAAPSAAIDTLVCRIDQRDARGQLRPAWTRLGGQARMRVFVTRAREGEAPKLLGAMGDRVYDQSGIFDPVAGNKADANGTVHNLDVTFNDIEPASRSTVQKVRMHYELTDAASDDPTVAASYSIGQEGSAFTGLSGTAPENDGATPKVWPVVKRTRRFRLRLVSSGATSRLRIKLVEFFVRDSNRP
jgi:hypothetical protein